MKLKGPYVKGDMFWAADEKITKIFKRRSRIGYNPRKARRFPDEKSWRVNKHYMDDE